MSAIWDSANWESAIWDATPWRGGLFFYQMLESKTGSVKDGITELYKNNNKKTHTNK